MKENNFEKQVRQKMDGLQINPSDIVWQKVAGAIAKRKSGRRVFAIIFLLLLFISSAIFILWDATSGSKISDGITAKENAAKTNNVKAPQNNSNKQQIISAANAPKTVSGDSTNERRKFIKEMAVTKKISNGQKPAPDPSPIKTVASSVVNNPVKNNAVTVIDDNGNVNKKANKITYKTKEKASMPISNPYPQDSVSETVESDDTNVFMPEKIIALINNEAINTQASDMVSKNKTGKIEPIKNPLPLQMIPDNSKDAAIKNSLGLKQNKQWQIGFNFSLGVAATKNGYLGIIGSGNGDGLKSFADMAQNTGSTTGQGATISYIPAKIQSGAGVTVGVFVQKNISPKTNFLIGLNYKKYSSAMMIGGRVDSFVIVSNFNRVNEFYRSGDKIKYKNNFHFIELPVALQIKLGKQKKAPVYFNTGVSISQLLGSNALQFDTRSGAYYSNNALLNKTQVNVSAGFLFSLSGNAKYPFLIGPDMNYSLTKMAKSGLFKNRHYSYFGIQVQKVIGKK